MNILNSLKDRLELKLKYDLSLLSNPTPSINDDDDDETCEGEEEDNDDDEKTKMAYTIFCENTGRGYNRIVKEMKGSKSFPTLPSKYKLDQQLPRKVGSIEYCLDDSKKATGTGDDDDGYLLSRDLREQIILGNDVDNRIKTELDALAMFSQTNIEEDEIKEIQG